jgi:hypothetical protein
MHLCHPPSLCVQFLLVVVEVVDLLVVVFCYMDFELVGEVVHYSIVGEVQIDTVVRIVDIAVHTSVVHIVVESFLVEVLLVLVLLLLALLLLVLIQLV